MLQINTHDKSYDEQGYFTYKDTWLYVTTSVDFNDTALNVGNITHFTVISATQSQVPYPECIFPTSSL